MSKPVLTAKDIAAVIDHTFLKTEKEGVSLLQQEMALRELVKEATDWGAFAVCVREQKVAFTKRLLNAANSPCRIVSVVGFPVGDDHSTSAIIDLYRQAKHDGAAEFDMVVKVKWIKDEKWDLFSDEILAISNAVGKDVLKIIFENAYLTDDEKKKAYRYAKGAVQESWRGMGLDPRQAVRFFKTSTGFATKSYSGKTGATLQDVKLMASIAGKDFGIKPAGGIGTLAEAIKFWEGAGAPYLEHKNQIDPMRYRIGSSSLLAHLFNAATSKEKY